MTDMGFPHRGQIIRFRNSACILFPCLPLPRPLSLRLLFALNHCSSVIRPGTSKTTFSLSGFGRTKVLFIPIVKSPSGFSGFGALPLCRVSRVLGYLPIMSFLFCQMIPPLFLPRPATRSLIPSPPGCQWRAKARAKPLPLTT